jgi:glycosyltransferase involved in cell wall biosynthesis
MSRRRLVHVITGLANGGAEGVLFRLVAATRERVDHRVVSLRDEGIYGPRLRELGIPVVALGADSAVGAVRLLPRLWRRLRTWRPEVVQTWMYHADLAGGVAARLAGCRNVVWGIRHSNLDREKWTTRRVARWCATWSGIIPRAIVCNSEVAAGIHQKLGYRSDRFRIIGNGIDLERFAPDPAAREGLRQEWRAAPGELLLGMVSRWNRQKDFGNLLAALRILHDRGLSFRCVLTGTGMDGNNENLRTLIQEKGLAAQVLLTGPRNDVPAVMNALDVHILSSRGEAFPNVVAESMACGTPCIVTDVGDAAQIVGDPNRLVPVQAPELLAEAVWRLRGELARDGRESIGARCRARMAERFGLERMTQAYLSLWNELAGAAR